MSNPILELSNTIKVAVEKQIDQPMTRQVVATIHGDCLDAILKWLDDQGLLQARELK